MRFLLFSFFSILSVSLFGNGGSENSEKKLVRTARKLFLYGQYQDAIQKYEEALKLNPNSPDHLFEIGLCYFEDEIHKEKALEYFESALKNSTKDTIPELLYYLGQTYQFEQKFEEAVYCYQLFDKKIKTNDEGQDLRRQTRQLVEMCNNGRSFLTYQDQNISIENLGGMINSSYSEYAPVINGDGSLLVFTARKKGSTGGEIYHDNAYFEDIYVSNWVDQKWTSPVKLDENSQYTSEKLNFLFHDAAIAFNENETSLYIYRDNDVWESSIKDGKFLVPVKLNDFINTKEHEPSVSITPDGKTMFLVSNRKGGLGGRDLYFTQKLADGTWSEVKSMGPNINTPFDDDAPFVSADGKTLYFSSKGHKTMGGYDIFKSEMDENGNWGNPVNVGLPINSGGDDIFYTEDKKGNGYFASDRMDGMGSMDIYKVTRQSATKDSVDITVADSIISQNNSDLSEISGEKENDPDINQSENNSASIAISSFKMNYDYNNFGIKSEDEKYVRFIDELLHIVKVNGKVILNLESSASRVPTTTYKSNQDLAEIRLDNAVSQIKSDLMKKGVKESQIIIEKSSATVQGPAYKDDYLNAKDSYLQFQYLSVQGK